MSEDLGRRLFSFGVIIDAHLNQGEDDCNSPFEVNTLANRRMRHVVRDLNARDLAFVVNVGDLVHPVPAIPNLYAEAAARFHEQVADLKHPLYLTPGNHDVGDKPNDWAPAAGVHEDHLALWDQHFGAQYQSFDHDDCHFIIINAQIINSGFSGEVAQRDWLEKDLEANKGKRNFLHSHYPPYFTKPDEDENYDNIGEPGRTWILELLETYGVEALFIGHVHNFWYYRHAGTDCYLLPSTAFVRQDYSEMYRVSPGADSEFGRNDKPKLGYFIVHVHEGGHVCDIVRTYGAVVDAESPETPVPERVAPVHPRLNRRSDFGFDMRQNWMEIIELPPTGGLDEFDRKEVRNDYPLMALWEMGIRKVRIPLRDLLVSRNRDRLRMLKAHGHEFVLFSFGDPAPHYHDLILAHQDIFSAWEIGMNWNVLERIVGGIGEIAGQVDIPVYLSRLRSIDEQRTEAGKYYHAINQGFLPDDRDQMAGLLTRPELDGVVAGFVFRLTLDKSPWETIATAHAIATELDVAASVHLRMSGANPALETADDYLMVHRIAEAMAAVCAFDNVTVYADTFADFDRGYFPRQGVLDRLWNPRLGFHVVRHLNAALNGIGGLLTPSDGGSFPGGSFVTLKSDKGLITLALPNPATSEMVLSLPEGHASAQRIDLRTGIITPLETAAAGGATLVLAFPGGDAVPTLIVPGYRTP